MSEEKITEKAQPNFSKLLVAVDGSETSDYALNLAIHIGESFDSQIDLLYVYGPSAPVPLTTPLYDPVSGGTILSPPVESDSDYQKILAKNMALLDDRKRLIKKRGLQCNPISIESDDVAGEIMKLATNGGYNLVVLGSRGLSGLKSLILGSVSRKVSRESKTSVLVVKTKVDRLPKILIAFDGSDESRNALDAGAEIGSRLKAEVDSISVVAVPLSPEAMIVPERIAEWEKDMAGHVREAVDVLKSKGITQCQGKIVDSSDIARAITDEASNGAYDLIVLGSRGFGRLKSFFLGSVATKVADSSKTNVLIVR